MIGTCFMLAGWMLLLIASILKMVANFRETQRMDANAAEDYRVFRGRMRLLCRRWNISEPGDGKNIWL